MLALYNSIVILKVNVDMLNALVLVKTNNEIFFSKIDYYCRIPDGSPGKKLIA